MQRSYENITLDLRSRHGACQPELKQGDTHRSLYMTLTDGGRPYTVASDCSAVFMCKKPDGTALYNFCQVQNNTVIYDVTPQTTATAGILECELRLYDAPAYTLTDRQGNLSLGQADAQLLSTMPFTLLVQPTLYDGDTIPPSAGEITALEQLVSQASGLIDYLLDAKNNGTFQGQKGDPGPQGEKGDPGEPTPQVLENTSRINSLETQMGEAAAALDAILALQNTLIGGAEA